MRSRSLPERSRKPVVAARRELTINEPVYFKGVVKLL